MTMAEKTMTRAVQVGTKRFVPGEEDELEKALTKKEVERLTDRGVLKGSFKGQRKEDEDVVQFPGAGTDEHQDPTVRAGAAATQRRKKLREEAKTKAQVDRPNPDEPVKLKTTGEGDPLADDFPAKAELEAAGLKTMDDVRANADNLEKLDGVGKAKAKQIREQL